MSKVLAMDSLLIYKEALRRLQENNIAFDKVKLLNNPELCMEIIKLMDYHNKNKNN